MTASVEKKVKDNNKIVKEMFKQFLAGLYLDNCDKLKYGEFISYLYTQYGLVNDQYPKTLNAAHQALATVKIDKAYWEKKAKAKKKKAAAGPTPPLRRSPRLAAKRKALEPPPPPRRSPRIAAKNKAAAAA